MPKQKINEFTEWELTEDEELQGSVLTIGQRQVVQNKLATIAIEINNGVFDPLNPMEYALRKAELQGQRGVLQWLLELSDAAVTELAERANQRQYQPNDVDQPN